ncbi:MAG: lipopolysaccharide biosynthesis protein [Phenylobacterium sp.]|nr:lipopolysaccharide biosynthesis protein [Phenylobacterium sp.]
MAAQGAWAETRDRGRSSHRPRRRFALPDLPILLWRERRLILAVFLTVLALGLLAAFAMKTSYQAYSSLLVRLGPEYVYDPGAGGAGRGAALSSDQMLQSEIEILAARDLPVRVTERLGVPRTYPALAAKYARSSAAEQRRIRDAAARDIQQNLSIETTPGSPVVRVRFSHRDPEAAALVLNTLLEEYLIYRRAVLLASEPAALDRQRRLFEARLAKADSAYQDFLASNRIADFIAEKNALTELHAKVEHQRQQTQVQLQDRTGRLAALSAQLGHVAREVRLHRDVADGAAVRTRTGVNPVHRSLQAEKIQLTAEVAALKRAQTALAGQIDDLIERRLRLAALESRFQKLSLAREVLQASVRDVAVREEQGRAAREMALLANESIRIVQRAAPPTRGTSLRWPVAALALLLASLAGLGAGVARMLMRPGLPTAQVASRSLGLPVLGAAAMKPR